MTREKPNAQPQSTATTEWRKGWTPWGTPCSVRVENGQWLTRQRNVTARWADWQPGMRPAQPECRATPGVRVLKCRDCSGSSDNTCNNVAAEHRDGDVSAVAFGTPLPKPHVRLRR